MPKSSSCSKQSWIAQNGSKLLEDLVAGGDRGVETHSLLASAYKDLWEQSTDSDSNKNTPSWLLQDMRRVFPPIALTI